MSQVPDAALDDVWTRGFALVEGFLDGAELAAAQAALPQLLPSSERYHRSPERYAHLVADQFAGNLKYPFGQLALDRLAYHPDLISAAERFFDNTDLAVYKVELWGKYSGAVDYDQRHHRDYGNHNLLVPRADRRWTQLTTWLLLSDVTEQDGPTMVVPRDGGDQPLLSTRYQSETNGLRDTEIPVVGPAGTLFLYTTDVFHRGSAMTGSRRARFIYGVDIMERGAPWLGKMAWPDRAPQSGWNEILGDCTPRQRELFGIPPPGHDYWTEQTIRDVAVRWPAWDMTPYAAAMPDT
mgnify:CR=1 FL=1